MIAKTFEVRDRATFIPVLAVKLEAGNEADRYLLARSGYGRTPAEQASFVLFCGLEGGHVEYNPEAHGRGRTRRVAHAYIRNHFDGLESGAVIDVEFIAGETTAPKRSEREESHP